MKRALLGLSLFSLATLATPVIASADGGWTVVTTDTTDLNVPGPADDANEAAIINSIGDDPALYPMPSRLPAMASADAATALTVESVIAE
jgi:hypothetical protein